MHIITLVIAHIQRREPETVRSIIHPKGVSRYQYNCFKRNCLYVSFITTLILSVSLRKSLLSQEQIFHLDLVSSTLMGDLLGGSRGRVSVHSNPRVEVQRLTGSCPIIHHNTVTTLFDTPFVDAFKISSLKKVTITHTLR